MFAKALQCNPTVVLGTCLENNSQMTAEECGCWPHFNFRRIGQNGQLNWDKPGRPDPADFTIADEVGSIKGRLPGTIDGQQFMIRNCKDSQIFLFDHSATITVDDCENCKFVFGPIKGSVFFRNCKDCHSVVACQQFRTRDCKKMETFLCCTSQPIIEASTGMKFGCFQYNYPELKEQFRKAGLSVFNNNWGNIHDFTPVPGETNWSMLPEDVAVESHVPFPTADELSAMQISTKADDSVVPVTRGNRQKNHSESCLLVFFGGSINHCIEFMKKLKEKGTCDIIQTKQLQMTTEDASRIFQNNNYATAVDQGPVVGVEINGPNCIKNSQEISSILDIKESELHISSKERAQSEIDAFYNFVDMSMS